MSNLEKARIILLKKTKYAESDLIVQGLSSAGEKLSFIARGALRSKKRFAGGVLEPTHYVELVYRRPSFQQQLFVLENALLLDDFPGLRSDYDKLSLALRLVEVISKVGQEGDTQSGSLFNLLGHALRHLQESQDLERFGMQFYLKFLFQQGVLEPEPWMEPFLKKPLSEHFDLKIKVEAQQQNWIQGQVERYLVTAE